MLLLGTIYFCHVSVTDGRLQREVFKHRVDKKKKKKGSDNLTNVIGWTLGIPKGFSTQAVKRVEELKNYN